MAHIPYYGEDLQNTQEKNKMIFNLNQLINHNKNFYNSFVDLKVVGWKSYSKALNTYTNNFFKAQLDDCDKAVEKLGEDMKTQFSKPQGICK